MSFRNEPLADLRRSNVRDELLEAMAGLDGRLPVSAPVRLAEQTRAGDDLLSTDPGRPDRVVAAAAISSPEEIEAAVADAGRAGSTWSRRSADERAQILERAAAGLRRRRSAATALAVREAAKPWIEADADVCEAIDFLSYYAAEAHRLDDSALLLQPPGERNRLEHVARGVAAVIAPWNFPLAIPCGMTAAALAAGNAVLLKPAEQTPGCGALLHEVLIEAGVPAGVCQLLPGEGDVGAALVAHRDVQVIAFTGSAVVGREIIRTAAEWQPGQRHLKHVVAEMGGKNCIIVDADADLDDAVPGVVSSAFGFAGQKCSAASRVLVAESIAEAFNERLAGAVAILVVERADRFGVDVPPVIDSEARDRVAGYREDALAVGRLLASAEQHPDTGWFCPPTVIAGLPADAPVLREEVFGPLLTVTEFGTLEQALDIIDGLPFALTGGLYSRHPEHIAEVIGRSPVGNLYVNRAITGAMVARQPFGGHRLSGTGSKAGGPDYLRQFSQARVVTENTERHGLIV